MPLATKTCLVCKANFPVDEDDAAFFERMEVPAPTHCPRCRMVRRQIWRNERALYKRACGLCGKETITMYAPEKEFTVYCTACYQSDKWDPLSYGRSYDFSKPFFAQFAELMRIVPRHALYQDFAEGSEYSNWAVYLKNSYLIFGGHHYEDTAYAAQSFFLRDCADVDFAPMQQRAFQLVLRGLRRFVVSLRMPELPSLRRLYQSAERFLLHLQRAVHERRI